MSPRATAALVGQIRLVGRLVDALDERRLARIAALEAELADARDVLTAICEHIRDEDWTSASQVARHAGHAAISKATAGGVGEDAGRVKP